jgi:hypothetical protein
MNNFRRSRSSNTLKDKCREAAVEILREASQVGVQVNKSLWRKHFFTSQNQQRKDERRNRNPEGDPSHQS